MNSVRIPLSSPDITEEEIKVVLRILRSGRLSLGPELQSFEEEMARYIGTKYAVAVSSGTAGLHCVVRALGLKDGDEVITSPFSFIASANCLLFERVKPVFVDIDPRTLCLDAEKIEKKITPRTKAILAVHLVGIPCPMDRIQQIADKHKLVVIEDACEAIGAAWGEKKLGSIGNAGVFAFYPNKQMTTGEGGVITTNDAELARICKSLRNQGRSQEDGYLFERLGYNYRLTDFQAAIGRVQLARMSEILERRRQVAAWYFEELGNVRDILLPPRTGDGRESWFIFLIRLSETYSSSDRNTLRQLLRQDGIETGAYFSPIHLQPFYQSQFGYKEGDFPVTEHVAARTLALPFYNQLSSGEVSYVTGNLISYLKLLEKKSMSKTVYHES